METTLHHCSTKCLAEAFTIMAKYSKDEYVTQAEHTQVWAGMDIDMDDVPEADIRRLHELGWVPTIDGGFHKHI